MVPKLRKPRESSPRLWGGRRQGEGGGGLGASRNEAQALQVRWAEAVETARKEWLAARAYFDYVTDPELVDHAIFAAQAAERKYMYLLRRARLAGAALDRPAGEDAPSEDRQAPGDEYGLTEEVARGT